MAETETHKSGGGAGAPNRICGTCVFWRAASNDPSANIGRCFRFPPNAKTNGDHVHPVTGRLDWCGEHKSLGEDALGFAHAGGLA